MKLFNKKTTNEILVASIDGQHCRIHHFLIQADSLKQTHFSDFAYTNINDLKQLFLQWCKKNAIKNSLCRWLLSHELYQTYQTDTPNVLENEMAEALKWQIKDQLDLPVNEVLISFYRPNHPDPDYKQLIAVSVEKKLVEALIDITQIGGLFLDTIEIEELAIGKALLPYFEPEKIIGYVGENKSGLVFNFYSNNKLVFCRYKKGLFIPATANEEFSLESDSQDQEEAFLLETQRTLDYVISQLFRKPIDLILLQQNDQRQDTLAETINQIVETQVILVKPNIELSDSSEQQTTVTLSEAGCALAVSL